MNGKNLDKLITEVLAIEAEAAKDAGAIGYMARAMVQATMPHSDPGDVSVWGRKNGSFSLVIQPGYTFDKNNKPSRIGLPYGVIPRLLLSWISTEAVRTKERDLILGRTLSAFMEELDLMPTGGRWGTITRLKDQMKRLFAASISCTYDDGDHWAIRNISPISKADLWWNPKHPDQAAVFESTLTLNEDFFKEIINNPVPIDMRALKALKRSPLAIDIYCWLTYRLSYLRESTTIPWEVLQIQFGANYSTNPQGVRDFKKAFLRELRKVTLFFQRTVLESVKDGLKIKQGTPHIKKLINM